MIEVGNQMSWRDRVLDQADQLVYPLAVAVLSRSDERSRTNWVEAIADVVRKTGKVDWRARLSLWVLRGKDRRMANRVIRNARNEYRILDQVFPNGIPLDSRL